MTVKAPRMARIDYLDGLRAALMLLGIPYHAALAFSGGGWLVSSPVDSPVLAEIAEFLHAWRMPAFFIVAGFFAGLIIPRRGPKLWFRGRLTRLGVPLVFGILLTVPIQWVLVGHYRYGNWPETWTFVRNLAAAQSEWWVLHLWFLLELLIYCAVVTVVTRSPLRLAIGRLANAIANGVRMHPIVVGAAVLLSASTVVVVGRAAWTFLHVDDILGGLVSRNLVVYAPAFAVGALLGARRDLLARVASRGSAVVFAVVAVAASIVATFTPDAGLGAVVGSAASTVVGLSAAFVAIYAARQLLDRQRRIIRWLVDASLVIYIVHQPLILALAIGFFSVGVFGLLGWGVTVVATLLIAAALYELVNITPGLRFFLTGRAERQASLVVNRPVPQPL